jgi:hypothetical protein
MHSVKAATMAAVAGALALAVAPARASPLSFGTLDNFDVYNDTGQETHGFEIELEGIGSSDVMFTFGAPYIRYGDPEIVSTPTGVAVRYRSGFDGTNFTATTPIPTVLSPTSGHDCYQSSGIGNYATSGCEHFGVSLNAQPTRTTYNWLVADPGTPGGLQVFGTSVLLPAPIFNVIPPAVPGDPPVVQALIQAPEAPDPLPGEEPQWGEAIWVKVFTTEQPVHLELENLVSDDPAVEDALAEPPEIEFALLQSPPAGEAGENEDLLGEGELGEEDGAVVRRYEFFKYVGLYDPESHEALCDDAILCPEAIGDYIGAQMAAVNFAGGEPVLIPGGGTGVAEPAPFALLGMGLVGLAAARRRTA